MRLLPVAAAIFLVTTVSLSAQHTRGETINPFSDTYPTGPADRDRLAPVLGSGLEGSLVLDDYILASGKHHPIAIVVHGGGYTSGSRRGWNELALTNALLDAHFSVFTVAYHLAPEASQELMVREIQRTVRFARSQASKFNLDPSRIVLVGDEVGGLLAAAAALAPPSTEPHSYFSYDRESDEVQAVVVIGCAGQFGKDTPLPRPSAPPLETDRELFKRGLPKYFTRTKDVPIHPVDTASQKFRPDASPFLIIRGSSINQTGCAESSGLYTALQHSGDQVKLLDTSLDHPSHWKLQAYRKPAWEKDMVAWLKTTIATPQHP